MNSEVLATIAIWFNMLFLSSALLIHVGSFIANRFFFQSVTFMPEKRRKLNFKYLLLLFGCMLTFQIFPLISILFFYVTFVVLVLIALWFTIGIIFRYKIFKFRK